MSIDTLAFELNPLKDRQRTRISDTVKEVPSGLDPLLLPLFNAYAQFQDSLREDEDADESILLDSLHLPALDPGQMLSLFKAIGRHVYDPSIRSEEPLVYFSRLLNASHRGGHNDFILDTNELNFNSEYYGLFRRIHGSKNTAMVLDLFGIGYGLKDVRYCDITLHDSLPYGVGYLAKDSRFHFLKDVPDYSLKNSRNLTVIVEENAGNGLGDHTIDSTITIHGNAGNTLGENSIDSNYTVLGDVGDSCGYHAKRCEFTIHGDVGKLFSYGAVLCTFKTPNQDTYTKMLDAVNRQNTISGSLNRAELIE